MTEEETLVQETETTEEPITVETISTEEEGVTVNVTIAQPAAASEEALVEDEAAAEEDSAGGGTYTVTSPVVLAAAQSNDNASSMVQVIESVLGEYQRITYTTEEYDADGNLVASTTEYVPGLAGLDYAWIAGAVLFGLVIAGCLKLLGGLIRS